MSLNWKKKLMLFMPRNNQPTDTFHQGRAELHLRPVTSSLPVYERTALHKETAAGFVPVSASFIIANGRGSKFGHASWCKLSLCHWGTAPTASTAGRGEAGPTSPGWTDWWQLCPCMLLDVSLACLTHSSMAVCPSYPFTICFLITSYWACFVSCFTQV